MPSLFQIARHLSLCRDPSSASVDGDVDGESLDDARKNQIEINLGHDVVLLLKDADAVQVRIDWSDGFQVEFTFRHELDFALKAKQVFRLVEGTVNGLALGFPVQST